VIERFLNAGGFGITYLARDSLDRLVVLKECYPTTMCCRSEAHVRARSRAQQMEFDTVVRLFGQEARRLSKLRHPNIVGVHQVFEDNGTAYMALDFVEGRDLLDVIDEEPHRLAPQEVQRMLRCLLDAVEHVHEAGMLHRDISPDNILLRRDGEPVLIDFGAARDVARRSSRTLSSAHVVKDGYSPQEFYLSGSEHNRASDLYSLGASFYHVLTGEAPPHSHARLAALASNKRDPYNRLIGRIPGYPPGFLQAIDRALEVFPEDRVQSAGAWVESIDQARRQRALKILAEQDSQIEDTIRRLVEETNPIVEAAQRERARQEAERKAAEAEAARLAAEKRARLRAEARAEAEEAAQWAAKRRVSFGVPSAREDTADRLSGHDRPGWRKLMRAPFRRSVALEDTLGFNEVET